MTADVSAERASPYRSARGRRRPRRRTAVAVAAVVTCVAAGALVITDPFSSSGSSHAAAPSAAAGSTATVSRRSLSSQTQVDATLGYANSYSVVNELPGMASANGAPGSNSSQSPNVATALPAVGQVISQGHGLYSVNGTPVVLLYGATPAYRNLSEGDSGADVAQLNADLVSLGDATASQLDPKSDYFSSATAAGLEKLQANLGITQTGTLSLGQAVFLPTRLRVTTLSATLGGPISTGATVLEGTSTTRQVQVALDASLQSEVAVGDKVMITLPNNQTTPGVVSSVGTVATCPSGPGSSGSGSSGSGSDSCPSGSQGTSGSTAPTVTVDINPLDPQTTGTWDQAPVQVTITTGTVQDALVVPITALLAQGGGGYAVEVVGAGGVGRLVPVSLGLFDDADGLVQVSGSGLAADQKVVVPST